MRVLIVEDEPGIVEFVCQGLGEVGHAVDAARDGQ
jgi:DNA-binding response OmpR family regulator